MQSKGLSSLLQHQSLKASILSVQLFETPWTVATRLFCAWDSPGKSIGMGSHSLLQGYSGQRYQTQISGIAGRFLSYVKMQYSLRVPWTARRSSQSFLKEISPGCSLEGLMLKLKCQYFGHLMRKADSLEKTLMLGKIEGRRRE